MTTYDITIRNPNHVILLSQTSVFEANIYIGVSPNVQTLKHIKRKCNRGLKKDAHSCCSIHSIYISIEVVKDSE